jgi:hypothetical protein
MNSEVANRNFEVRSIPGRELPLVSKKTPRLKYRFDTVSFSPLSVQFAKLSRLSASLNA